MLFYITVVAAVVLVIATKAYQKRSRKLKSATKARSQEAWRQKLNHSAREMLSARNYRELQEVIDSLDEEVVLLIRRHTYPRKPTSLFDLAANKHLVYMRRAEDRRARYKHESSRHQLMDRLFASKTLAGKFVALAKLVEHEEPSAERKEAIESYFEDSALLEEIHELASRDLQGYLEVAALMKRVWCRDHWGHTGDLVSLRDFVTYPDDWHELVVRFRKDPAIDEFPFVEKLGISSMLVAENAAAAVRDRDLAPAQIARAHAADTPDYRTMMGDVLLEQLHRLVAELHAERGLFQDETAGSVKG